MAIHGAPTAAHEAHPPGDSEGWAIRQVRKDAAVARIEAARKYERQRARRYAPGQFVYDLVAIALTLASGHYVAWMYRSAMRAGNPHLTAVTSAHQMLVCVLVVTTAGMWVIRILLRAINRRHGERDAITNRQHRERMLAIGASEAAAALRHQQQDRAARALAESHRITADLFRELGHVAHAERLIEQAEIMAAINVIPLDDRRRRPR